MKLNNKRILITGASSGIGLELTRQLLKTPGTQIMGVARRVDTLESIGNSRLYPLSADITLPENIEYMLDEAIVKMGGIDVIIACAGFAYYEKFENTDYEHIKRIYETNVLSPLYTLQKFLQKTQGQVSFVTLASAVGKFGLPGYALYCSSKFALDGFHDSFRFEPHDRLHYMTVYPVGVKTNFWVRIHSHMPLPRPLQSVEASASAIILGLKLNKKRVYTARWFYLVWGVNRVLPFILWTYQKIYQSLFGRWLKGKS